MASIEQNAPSPNNSNQSSAFTANWNNHAIDSGKNLQ